MTKRDDDTFDRLKRIEDRVIDIHEWVGGTTEWRSSVDEELRAHGVDIKALNKMQYKVIGAWTALALLGGIGFQLLVGG